MVLEDESVPVDIHKYLSCEESVEILPRKQSCYNNIDFHIAEKSESGREKTIDRPFSSSRHRQQWVDLDRRAIGGLQKAFRLSR